MSQIIHDFVRLVCEIRYCLIKKLSAAREIKALPWIAALAAGFITIVFIIFLILRASYPTPFWDEFYFYQIYSGAASGSIDYGEIIKPHNGHIYTLLKLWMWMVVYVGLDWRISMYVQSVLLGLVAVIIVRYALEKRISLSTIVVVVSLIMIVGSARQWENLYWAMQVSLALMMLSSVTAFYLVYLFSETGQYKYAILAVLSSIVALNSFGTGLVTVFVTAASIALISKNIYIRTFVIAVGAVCISLYLGLIHVSDTAVDGESILTAANFIVYCLSFFSSSLISFSPKGDDPYSLALGSIVLLLTLYSVCSTLKQKKVNIFPFLLIIFSLLTCVLVAYARLKSGSWQPNASRYYPFASLILVGNVLILGTSHEKPDKVLGSALSALVLISFVLGYASEWKVAPYRYRYLKTAHEYLCDGLNKGLAFYANIEYIDLSVIRNAFCLNQGRLGAKARFRPDLIETGPRLVEKNIGFNRQLDGRSGM